MPVRLAVDFGTSNTVLAFWDPERGEGVPLHLPQYGHKLTAKDHVRGPASVIPSLINYPPNGDPLLGRQVLDHQFYDSPSTIRWMKRYIARRSPVRFKIAGRDISHRDAGRDFLTGILKAAVGQVGLGDEPVGFTVPVEAYEDYQDWLLRLGEGAGMPRFRLLDEATAAALGYGVDVQPGDVFLVFDFGGGTLDVSIVLMEADVGQASGRRCRVLGKAGADLGGATVDGWLYQEVLRQVGKSDADDKVRPLSRALLVQCEHAKELLSFQDRADVAVQSADGTTQISAALTRATLEALFDRHEGFAEIDHTIRRALNAARERGYTEDAIKAVLKVGGSSLMPAVHKLLERIFGRQRVPAGRPVDAVARGAAAFLAGVDFYDHIQHDYAIRHVAPEGGDYEFRLLVRRGTAYPTDEPVARLTIKASHEGQSQLGLAVFELGEPWQHRSEPPVELLFDAQGAARLRRVSTDDDNRRYYLWVNEQNPTFLHADPPAKKSEPRFEVEFHIDASKRLLITARDLKTREIPYRNHPIARLT
jgi:molecular chaperone DnaK (HSP70)